MTRPTPPTTVEIMGSIVEMAHRDNDGKGANDTYDRDGIVARASAAPPLPMCDEHVLNVLLARLREEGLTLNAPFNPRVHVYGAPVLTLLDSDFDVVHERVWSRTFHDLLELTLVAKAIHGLLMVNVDVEYLDGDGSHADGGFDVEVWPRLRVRPSHA